MKKRQQQSNHADLARFRPRTAWRIYLMRFLDRWVGPAVLVALRRLLTSVALLTVTGSCNLHGPFVSDADSSRHATAKTDRDNLRP